MHFRVFMRILAPYASLYTEMQTIGAIQYQPTRALAFHVSELPYLALQVGGSDPKGLVSVAKQAEQLGFSEINLNLGCPSDKVQAGQFGACLMHNAQHVAACIQAMKNAVSIPVTAKTRIGIDHQDSYEFFAAFVHTLLASGCDKLIVHARKAWLNGLSPKENRTIPPLHYDYVYKIKQEAGEIPVIMNGNIQPQEILNHLQKVDGVMLGRLACDDPYQIAKIHHVLYPEIPLISRTDALKQYIAYLMTLSEPVRSLSLLLKPILNLAHGLPNNRQWKSKLLACKRIEHSQFKEAIEFLTEIEFK